MYQLSGLPYDYNSLEPFIDGETMKLHHDKHHAAYVKGANLALEKIVKMREDGASSEIRQWSLSLSFNASGHLLHSLFWEVMAPVKENHLPEGRVVEAINRDFGSLDKFLQEFKAIAMSIEGSGWAALVFDPLSQKLMTIPIEKHNLLGISGTSPILVLDVWEHAYYLKYQNDRQTYVDNFINLINWQAVAKKLEKLSY